MRAGMPAFHSETLAVTFDRCYLLTVALLSPIKSLLDVAGMFVA
jgi:hypothetical protein